MAPHHTTGADRTQHLWIIAPINTPGLADKLGIRLQIGAATRKVFGILYAAQAVGWKGHLASTPIIGHHRRWHITPAANLVEHGIDVHYAPAIGVPWLSRLFAAWNYLMLAFRLHRKRDHVIFYNFFLEYAPAALVLLCRGMRATIDIEDYPDNKKGFRSLLNRLSYPIIRNLCHSHPIVASTGIADIDKAEKFCVIHGILTPEDMGLDQRDNEVIRILYGGTIKADTGSEICAEAFKILRKNNAANVTVELLVTGFGDVRLFQDLENEFHPLIKVRVCANLAPSEYLSILRSCHIGLCLKMPDSNVGMTTFPSKVVELTANGLALVSTAVSDVPHLFGDVALLLARADAPTLAAALHDLAADPQRIADLATRGHARTVERHAPVAVGHRLTTFLTSTTEN